METTNNILVQIQNLNVINVDNTAERPAVGGEMQVDLQWLLGIKDKQIAAQNKQLNNMLELYQILLDKYLTLKDEHSKLLKQLPGTAEK